MQGNITGEFWKLLEYLKVGESCHCHGEIMYEDTSWIEDDCPDTFFWIYYSISSCLAAALCHDFSLVDSVET